MKCSKVLSVACVFALLLTGFSVRSSEKTEIKIGYLSQDIEERPDLSNLQIRPENEGIAGAELSVKDNNTTGQFTGQVYSVAHEHIALDGDPVAAMQRLMEQDIHLIAANVPASSLLKLSDAAKDTGAILFNVSAPDDRLRDQECRANIFHIVPSRAMRTDALAQFLVKKNWNKWFLISGTHETDQLYAAAVRASAKKFGAKIIKEKAWEFGPDARRTAQAEVPAFTQVDDYDVIVVANEFADFGDYLAYRTWHPSIIAGTQGLVAVTWHPAQEQWGSAQLQSRFRKTYNRWMSELDYQVWAAIRTIGEAVTRTQSDDLNTLREYILSDTFELAGFKGLPMNFRTWNQQLRQPILLVQPTALVSRSPQDGFLHQRSTLDTMGLDDRDTECNLN